MKRYFLLALYFLLAICFTSKFSSDIRAQSIWGLANKTHRSTEIIPAGGNTIFSISNHLFFSSDLGQTFTVDDGSESAGVTGFALGSSDNFYFSSPNGLYSSPAYTDMNNENWVRIDSTDLPPITCLFVRAGGKSGADDIFAGSASGLWRRKPSGTVWTKIHDAGDGAPIFQVAAFNSNIYYRTQLTAYATHDGGATWSPVATNVSNANLTGIVTTSNNDLIIALNGPGGGQILHSIDGGNTFTGSKVIAFSSRTIQTLIANSLGDLYLGGGVRDDANPDSITQGYGLRFLSNGSAWEDFSTGLPSAPPSPEVIGMGFGSAGNVFAGTDSAGLWRTLLPSSVKQTASIDGVSLSQNYPNPASAFTIFTLSVDHSITGSLDVIDELGRKVLHVFDGNITPGMHNFRIEASLLPDGIYSYRLQSPEFNVSRSFIKSGK